MIIFQIPSYESSKILKDFSHFTLPLFSFQFIFYSILLFSFSKVYTFPRIFSHAIQIKLKSTIQTILQNNLLIEDEN